MSCHGIVELKKTYTIIDDVYDATIVQDSDEQVNQMASNWRGGGRVDGCDLL